MRAWTTIRSWLRTWWLTIPEPRLFSIGWGLAYLAICAAGVAALVAPPEFIADETSFAVRGSIGALNIVGTLVAMFSGYRDYWAGERLGLALMIGAGSIYIALLLQVQQTLGYSTLVSAAYLTALMLVLALRWMLIRWFTYRPRG